MTYIWHRRYGGYCACVACPLFQVYLKQPLAFHVSPSWCLYHKSSFETLQSPPFVAGEFSLSLLDAFSSAGKDQGSRKGSFVEHMEKVKKWKLPLVSKAPWWVRNDGLLDIELWKDSIWIRIQGLSILKGSGFISCTMASKLSPASEKTFPNNRSLSPYATGMSFPYWPVQKQIWVTFFLHWESIESTSYETFLILKRVIHVYKKFGNV